jgi:hypothetical protein
MVAPTRGASAANPANAAPLPKELADSLDGMKENAAKFLDEKLPIKERLKAYTDFQNNYMNRDVKMVAAGLTNEWDLDPKHPVQNSYVAPANDLANRITSSELFNRATALGSEQGVFASRAFANGQSPAGGTLQHWDGLSADEKQILYTIGLDATYTDGSRPYPTAEAFRATMVGAEQSQSKMMAGPTVGGGTKADKLEFLGKIENRAARDLAYLQNIRGTSGSGPQAVVDKIDLSTEGAKAAAQTLAQPVGTDGANDVALKALETLKQVSTQQREWLKSLQKGDKDKAEEAGKSGVNDLSASASATIGKLVTAESANTKKPGTLVSVEA